MQFYCYQSDILGPLGYLDAQKIFSGINVGVGPCVGTSVTEPVAIGGNLGEITGLANFFHASVYVSEIGDRVNYSFPIDLYLQGPESVSHWVLGTHGNPHFCHFFTYFTLPTSSGFLENP